MQISISELKQYLKCPRSYKLREIDGIQPQKKSLSFCQNSALRRAITELCSQRNLCDFTKEEIKSVCEKAWDEETTNPSIDLSELDTVVVQAKPATKNRKSIPAITKAQRMLANIQTWCFEFCREEVDAEILYTNIYFRTTIGNIEFVGFIDQIRKINDQLQILIFNTSCQPSNSMFLQKDFVASIYAHAARFGTLYPNYPDMSQEIKLEQIPLAAVYYFPYLERYQKRHGKNKKGDRKGNPLIDVMRTEKQLLDFEYNLLYTVSGMENEFFPAMPNSIGCSLCQYAHACNGISNVFDDLSFNVAEYEEEVPCN